MAHAERLPESVRREVEEQCTFMAQNVQNRTVGYPLATLRSSPSVEAGFVGLGAVSPAISWAVHFSIYGEVA
eukprot:1450650-Rhodomonas_salina.3